MTTIVTAGTANASGKHRIKACVDVLLDDLMNRAAKPTLHGPRSSIFAGDGTHLRQPVCRRDQAQSGQCVDRLASSRGLSTVATNLKAAGFDTKAARDAHSYELLGMSERALLINTWWKIDSRPDGGTAMRLRVLARVDSGQTGHANEIRSNE
jgi:hypothetical protein